MHRFPARPIDRNRPPVRAHDGEAFGACFVGQATEVSAHDRSDVGIHDRDDPVVPFAHAEWSQLCIPQSRLLEIHVGGHLIWFGKDSVEMHEQRMTFLREAFGA